MIHLPHLYVLAAVVAFIGLAAVMLIPRFLRAEKRRRARSQMPKWPHDFPLRKTYLSRKRPPGPVSTFSVRAEIAKLKPSERDPKTLLRTALRALPRRIAGIIVELPGTIYWGVQRRGWAKSGGYIAARTSRQMFGAGAFRLGVLVPENWFERRYPMQVWIPRDEIFRHLGVIGPTGAGKTTTLSLAIPWIAATSGQSIFMNDVKEPCEFFPWLVDWWRSWGRETINFAPHTPDESLCCELLHSARRDELDIIAEALLSADSGQESGAAGGGGNKFFDDAGKQFFAGLMRMMRFAPRRYCTLPALFKIVAMGGKALVEFAVKLESYMPEVPQIGVLASSDGRWASEVERLKWEEIRDACRAIVSAPPVKLEADGVQPRTHRGTRTDAALAAALEIVDRSGYEIHCWIRDARVAAWPRGNDAVSCSRPDFATAAWKEREADLERLWRARVREWRDLMGTLGTTFRQPETTFENIVLSTQNSLKMFADDMVATAFSHPEFDFRSVADRPTLFTVGAPLSRGAAGKFIASSFSKLVLNTVFSRRHKSPDVGLVMEEAPTLKDKDLPQTLSTVRSNGGAVIVIAQSDTQWKGLLGELAGTVNENLVNQLALKGTAGDTAKRIAERFGVAAIEKKSRNKSHGGESGGGSTGTSIEMVERLRVNEVTDVMINGESLGKLGAMSFGTAVEPFFFSLLQYWNDEVMVRTLNCTPNAAGELKPRENHRPYHRVKRTRVQPRLYADGSPVLLADRDSSTGQMRMVPQYDDVLGPDGTPQLDPHAVDPMRDTVDFIEPPDRPTYYEMEPVTLDVEDLVVLGITPPSAKELKELQERREAAAKKGASKGKTGSTDSATDQSGTLADGATGSVAAGVSAQAPLVLPPIRSWGWLYHGILALDSSFPLRQLAMPWVEWDDGRRGWSEIAQMTAEARRVGPTGGAPVVVRPSVAGESLVPLSETEIAAPLAAYLFLSAHVALDFVSWTNQHLRRANFAVQPPSVVRQLLAEVFGELDDFCSGIQAPEGLLGPWAASGAAIPVPVCTAMDNVLEDVRDRFGEATSPAELARKWAWARTRWYELAGDRNVPHTTDVAWRFALAEAITDFGALSRATFLDFRAVTDPTRYPDDAIRLLLTDENPKIHFLAKRAVLADIDYVPTETVQGEVRQVKPGPGRLALAELLSSPAAAAGLQWLTSDQTPVVSRIEEHLRINRKSNAA
ncbi:MAG: type IV secretory system conjugative DNA transfer family protein [Gemmatimonadaceae bacterium]